MGAPRIGGAPDVAVVLTSNGSRTQLDACLASLIPQCQRSDVRLVIVRADSTDAVEHLRSAVPAANVIAAPASASVRELRRIGMRDAAGDIVGMIDDTRPRGEAWVASLQQGRRVANAAVVRDVDDDAPISLAAGRMDSSK